MSVFFVQIGQNTGLHGRLFQTSGPEYQKPCSLTLIPVLVTAKTGMAGWTLPSLLCALCAVLCEM